MPRRSMYMTTVDVSHGLFIYDANVTRTGSKEECRDALVCKKSINYYYKSKKINYFLRYYFY